MNSHAVLISELAAARELIRTADRFWIAPKTCIKKSSDGAYLVLHYPSSVAVFLTKNCTWSNGGSLRAKRFNSPWEAQEYWEAHKQRLSTQPVDVCRG